MVFCSLVTNFTYIVCNICESSVSVISISYPITPAAAPIQMKDSFVVLKYMEMGNARDMKIWSL